MTKMEKKVRTKIKIEQKQSKDKSAENEAL